MLQKKSCKACGTYMITTAVGHIMSCGVCKEDIAWRRSRCAKMEAAAHVHTYEQAVNKGEISATAN